MNLSKENLVTLFSRWLVYCYAYYGLGDALVTDEEFDKLSRYLHSNWDNFEHIHKHLVNREDLECTGHHIKIPKIAQHTAIRLLKERDGSCLTDGSVSMKV